MESQGLSGDVSSRVVEVMAAIDKLSEDMEGNEDFLTAANRSLMDIAWLDQDKSRMDDMCRNGQLMAALVNAPKVTIEDF